MVILYELSVWVYSVNMSFGGFLREFNLFKNIEGQYGFKFWTRCSHVYMYGLSVVTRANSIFGVGNCLFWIIYNERLGNVLEALLWLGWIVFNSGEKVCVMCWYYGWSFIVHGMKYVLDLRLCAGGCSFIMLGIGPGFVSIFPHFCSILWIILCRFLFFNWIF